MANTLTEVMPKILAQGLLALRQNAIMTRVVNRSYEAEAQQKGSVINIPLPSAIAARDVTPGVTFASNVDSTPTSVQVTLDFWKEAPFQMSDKDIQEAMGGVLPMQASEAIKSLANAVDSYILGLHTKFYGAAGTAGTTPFNGSITAASTARKLLNRQLAPMTDRRAVLDPESEALLLITPNVLDVDKRGDAGGIIDGSIGRKLGFDFFMDQNVPTYTPGTGWVTGFIASTVGGAVGDTTLNIINATASGTIKVGDIFSLAGDTLGRQYVVTVTGTVSATVQKAITFYPPLLSTVATGATLVVIGTAYTANLTFHRDAIAWASRPLADVESAGSLMSSVVDPVSGIALRLEVSRQYKQTTWSFDILGGANVIRREFGAKVLG